MKQRRFEVFIAIILTLICYLGDYYLKERLVCGIVAFTLLWHVFNILWLIAMVVIGYWGLKEHEIKWVKVVWILVNFLIVSLLLCNKLIEHYWQHTFIPEATSNIIRTPFFFLMAAFLPRWFTQYSPSKQRSS